VKLNVGCGANVKPGWISIDTGYDTTLQLEIRERLAFDDGSVAMVYNQHLFEHLEYPLEARIFLVESLRVLSRSGSSAPNGHQYAYDLETLTMVLPEAGFVVRRELTPDLDSEYRRSASLYAQARKPGGRP